ncbi:MAG: LysR family transcriptional regulator ArgP [Gordonia sp. (in: high G+C Gram-positive bacteria)]
MDLGQDGLRTLTAVLDAGTFEAAAQRLHVTPSAVSQRVKAMEVSVGRILLRRTKPIVATADGEVLLRLARQWELLTTEADLELTGAPASASADAALTDLPRVHVPIAANADSLATWLLPALAQFHHTHPVAVEVLRDDETVNSLRLKTGEVMGAITANPLPIRGTAVAPLGVMRYLPVATPEYLRTWLPDGPTDAALAKAPMVHFDRNDHLQRSALAALTTRTLDPPAIYIPSSTEYHRAIEAGIGWGAVPLVQISEALKAGLVERFVDHHLDVPLFWQYWKLGSTLLSALTAEICAAATRELLAP